MANILEYKGYQTRVEFDAESLVLYGKIEGVRDLVNFEADSVDKVEQSFHEAVDDYLEFCEEVGKDPDKAYNGQFNIRIPSRLHRDLAMKAFREGDTLNKEVQKAIETYLYQEKPSQTTQYIIVNPDSKRSSIFNSNVSFWGHGEIKELWKDYSIQSIL